MPASATLLQAVMVTVELCGHPFTSETVATVFIEDLAGYPEPPVLAALKRCRLEHRGRLTVADVLSRIEDGRPGVETAWAQIATLTDERRSLVWCEEMRQAWAAALPPPERRRSRGRPDGVQGGVHPSAGRRAAGTDAAAVDAHPGQ